MKKFSFNKEKAAKAANAANGLENQKVTPANELLTTANVSQNDSECDPAADFLASISKPLASNIYNQNNNISSISNVSNKQHQIQKMEKCLHQRPCDFLCSAPPLRPFCAISGEAIFDMNRCPKNLWR